MLKSYEINVCFTKDVDWKFKNPHQFANDHLYERLLVILQHLIPNNQSTLLTHRIFPPKCNLQKKKLPDQTKKNKHYPMGPILSIPYDWIPSDPMHRGIYTSKTPRCQFDPRSKVLHARQLKSRWRCGKVCIGSMGLI